MNQHEHPMQIALSALESSLDRSKWRTKLRIQDIMLLQNPALQSNDFVRHLNYLCTLLLDGVAAGAIVLSTYDKICDEPYEEGDTEPILASDIIIVNGHEKRIEAYERMIAIPIANGKTYEESMDKIKGLSDSDRFNFIQDLNQNGLMRNRVFYRRVDTPRHKKTQDLPSLTTC